RRQAALAGLLPGWYPALHRGQPDPHGHRLPRCGVPARSGRLRRPRRTGGWSDGVTAVAGRRTRFGRGCGHERFADGGTRLCRVRDRYVHARRAVHPVAQQRLRRRGAGGRGAAGGAGGGVQLRDAGRRGGSRPGHVRRSASTTGGAAARPGPGPHGPRAAHHPAGIGDPARPAAPRGGLGGAGHAQPGRGRGEPCALGSRHFPCHLAGGRRRRAVMSTFSSLTVEDLRFPTSRHLDGSDAMNADPDYSAAYVVIGTDAGDEGHAFVFTIGRGNDVQAAAVEALRGYVLGRTVETVLADVGRMWRELVGDSQLRWLGPEKGVMHMAVGAVINALWDLKAMRAGVPLWELLAGMTPEEIVNLIDFRYLTDALTRAEALEILQKAEPGRAERREHLLAHGYPAYTTTPGWLGYSDEKLVRLCQEAVAEGFTQIKLKVGADLDQDVRRLRLAREAVGPDIRIAVDANQTWDVGPAIEWMRALAPFDPWWVEEPTSPD